MYFTMTQRLNILAIQLVVKTLWVFDWLCNFPQKLAYTAIKLSAVVLFFSFIFGLTTNVKTDFSRQLSYGLIDAFYTDPALTGMDKTLAAVLGASDFGNVPALVHKIDLPAITAKSVLVMDATTKKALFKLNSDARTAPASTTKLMTALVALDIYAVDDKLAVPYFCTVIDTQKAGLPESAEFTVKDFLYALLVTSAGDAACTLSTGKVSYNEFITLMNKKAQDLGMTNTAFTNSIGLDGVDSSHYSTAEDLYKLATAATKNELIQTIVATKEYTLTSADSRFSTQIHSTNKLLWELPHSVGVKTGTTLEAGEVLIYEYADELKNLYIIVMGSQNRFFDTEALLKWILDSYSW